MFKLLDPNEPSHFEHLAQMHRLRYRVFYETLGWRKGLNVYGNMEFDDYDHKFCRYLVRINGLDHVDACARLTKTIHPYMLDEVFPYCIEVEEPPHDEHVEEITRFCSDPNSAPENITGLMMGALLELGMQTGTKRYISLNDTRINPVVRKYGWDYHMLGHERRTPTEKIVALSYDVNQRYLDNVRSVVGIHGDLLDNGGQIYEFSEFLVRQDNGVDKTSPAIH